MPSTELKTGNEASARTSLPQNHCRRPLQQASQAPRRWLIALIASVLVLSWSSTSLLFDSVAATTTTESTRPAPLSRRSFTHVPTSSLTLLPSLSDPSPILNHEDKKSWLANFLIPRVPGEPGSVKARQMILDIFYSQLAPETGSASSNAGARTGWTVEEHATQADTPHGVKPFVNIVATKDPSARRKLVLAAHYDSKWFAKGDFVGATDSAAPCAMLVDLAVSLDRLLELQKAKRAKGGSDDDVTLQLIFFDGEEAWDRWTHTDSIYGSRALVSNWTATYDYPVVAHAAKPHEARKLTGHGRPIRRIDAIDHFILLDLLGAPDPTIPSYYASTHWLFKELVSAESRLRNSGYLYPTLVSSNDNGDKTFFIDRDPILTAGIEDDHLPFIANGVPVLHLIPSPFPRVWHTLKDDASALDWPTNYAWSMILRLFTLEYLGLDMPTKAARSEMEEDDDGWADDTWLRQERDHRIELASSAGEHGQSQ